MSRRVFVVGVGMTKFEKPGAKDWDYPDMAKEAITRALADAGLPWSAVQQACVGYVYGDSTCGQRAVYTMGPTGIPIYNVNNNCSTGSTALYMARQFIAGGISDCVLALGFEKMKKGSLVSQFDDRTNPLDQHVAVMVESHGIAPAPMAPQMFGNAGREHMKLYGTKPEHFGKIAEKNHRHSANNPYSQFQDVYTLAQIMSSKKVHEPITMLQACPTSDGAGAAILCSEAFVLKYGLQKSAIEIAGMSLTTDFESSFSENSMIKAVGFDMTKAAAQQALQQANMTVNDVQVVELHDCFSCNELITYEALGLCPIGKAGEFIDRGDNTYGGKYVVNPSGGLISKGHPLGATGLAQCAELCWQLRGLADKRQVKNVSGALQHNLGLGGAAVVTVYRRPNWTGVTSQVITSVSRADALIAPKSIEPSEKLPTTVNTNGPKADTPVAPKPQPKTEAAATSIPTKQAPAGSLKAEGVFNEMAKSITPDLVKKVNVVYRFDITGPSGSKSWLIDLKNGAGSIKECDETAKADCTIIIKDDDFVLLMQGKLNAQQAFMKGQIKLKGNMMLAQKLQLLTQPKSKL